MRILTFSIFLLFARLAAAASLSTAREADSLPISFVPQQEYSLSQSYDFAEPQSIFAVNSLMTDGDEAAPTQTFTLKARPTTVYRPRSPTAYQRARLRSLRGGESEAVEWEQVELMGPYVEDKHTLSQLARMTGNAYALPGQKNWYEIDPTWNHLPFGWEDPADGFRGHVFASASNATVVLAIKGTTLQGPTSKKDKFNDNLLFSCCCARVDFSWVFSTVCGCYANHWRCDEGCLSKALIEDSLFYNIGVDLINDLTALYPTSTIWLVGHSLGGSLASLLGTTFGLPAVTFEAPGERLAAQRLHLPLPPPARSNSSLSAIDTSSPMTHFGTPSVTHVYHNADPIPQGTCTGLGSLCTQAGYALETHCHLGKTIVFDTVGKLGWRVDVQTHTIKNMITKVLEAQVPGGWEVGKDGVVLDVPVAREELDCVDCYKWEFGDFKDAQCGVSSV